MCLVKTTPMKTPQSQLRKVLKARGASSAFSLVELLVVIAVIGIIAAIAIPNIAGITNSADTAKAQRNAQNIVSTYSAAIAAGAEPSDTKDEAIAAITSEAGLVPTSGAFAGQKFNSPMVSPESDNAAEYIGWDESNNTLTYIAGTATEEEEETP